MLILIRHSVTELHDALGAWNGLGSSIGSLWRQLHHGNHLTFDVVAVASFFGAIAALHIILPTVVSVDAVSRSMPIFVNASQVPGQILNIGYDSTGGMTDDFRQALLSIPYLYGQRNVSTMGLPAGLNVT